jgi:two-component system sensor histidine kinase KdpD
MKNGERSRLWGYLAGASVTATATVLSSLTANFLAPANLIVVYLLGVVVVAIRCGRGASILAFW